MSRALSDDFKERVRSQTDLVGLIGESVALQAVRGGRDFIGLCPFHDDHTPSFHVYPDRQYYRCWACNEGGDCYSFVMKRERLEFREALEMLARRANLEMPKSFRSSSVEPSEKATSNDALAWAEREFHECLLTAPFAAKARDYLADRGFTAETIKQFRLGYHPDNWEWLLGRAGRGVSGKRFTPEQLLAAGLAMKRKDGASYFDCFVDRVMFPIHDNKGAPVGFGGRVLPGASDAAGGKYINSNESPVFAKSRMLFAFHHAREAIVKAETAVVMEGYTDCIMAHQCGMPNAVATLGTALTDQQVALLKRFARKVVLVFDSDEAGQKATERALTKFLAQEVDLRILTLDGTGAKVDPADYLLKNGGDSFSQLVGDAVEAWDHKYELTVRRYGRDTVDARHRILKDMLEVLAQVSRSVMSTGADWQVRENIVLGKLTHQLGLSEQYVREQLQTLRKKSSAPTTTVQQAHTETTPESMPLSESQRNAATLSPKSRDDKAEFDLLAIVVTCPTTLPTVCESLQPGDLRNAALKELFQACLYLHARGIESSYENLTSSVEDLNLKRTAACVCEHARNVHAEQSLLEPTLRYLTQRRDVHAAEASFGAPHVMPASAGLDEKSKDLLRRATERLKARRKIEGPELN